MGGCAAKGKRQLLGSGAPRRAQCLELVGRQVGAAVDLASASPSHSQPGPAARPHFRESTLNGPPTPTLNVPGNMESPYPAPSLHTLA